MKVNIVKTIFTVVITQYANCGIGLDVIRMMLGQEKVGVLKHYVKIHSETMINYLQPITGLGNESLPDRAGVSRFATSCYPVRESRFVTALFRKPAPYFGAVVLSLYNDLLSGCFSINPVP
jgi:hypothetical protein